ncbi:MAG TPA: DUF2505 domain-containing protein [Nocardioidaceae bacterium]|nr:DUF2505 domain-containing protein [Nocardioidaceae bacterium]
MRFQHSSRYDAPPTDVYAMLTDATFREEVCRAVKSVDSSVDVTGSTVTIYQTQRVRKIPAFAAKLVGETIEIHQVERWTSPTQADLELTIPGKPGHLRATITLTPSGDGTDYRADGDLKVSVPLVGGKLESVIADLLELFLTREHQAGQAWLAGAR